MVEQVYEAFGRRDLPTVLDLVGDGIEIWQSDALPWGGTFRGPDEFREYAMGLTQHVDARVEPERILDAGDHTVMVGRSKGRAWQSEARFDVPVVHVWTVRDGRLARLEVHMDTARMLEALQG
jgi:hypothetical protein